MQLSYIDPTLGTAPPPTILIFTTSLQATILHQPNSGNCTTNNNIKTFLCKCKIQIYTRYHLFASNYLTSTQSWELNNNIKTPLCKIQIHKRGSALCMQLSSIDPTLETAQPPTILIFTTSLQATILHQPNPGN